MKCWYDPPFLPLHIVQEWRRGSTTPHAPFTGELCVCVCVRARTCACVCVRVRACACVCVRYAHLPVSLLHFHRDWLLLCVFHLSSTLSLFFPCSSTQPIIKHIAQICFSSHTSLSCYLYNYSAFVCYFH
jgi:hypothetical protein